MSPEIDSLLRTIQCRNDSLREIVNNPQEKRELVDAVDIPRSTLDDIVRELEDAGLVEYLNGRWRVTSLGQGALNVYDEYRTQIQSVVEAEPLFSDISNEVIDTDFLVSANLYKGDLAVPDEVLQVFFDAIKDATKLRWFTSIWFVGYSEQFYQKVTSQDDCRIELITSKEVFDHLKQTRPKIVDTLVNEAQMSFYVGEFSKPYGLWICDDELAGATICSERRINGVITNQTCNAIDWAENQYTHVKQTADQVSHEDNRSLVSNLS